MRTIIKLSVMLAGPVAFYSCGESKSAANVIANSNATFKIWGNCETCKETIESSLKVKGIAKADWNVDSKMMNVSFDSTKITLDQIEKTVAAVGYDNDKYKGDDNAYKGLPECCQYERK